MKTSEKVSVLIGFASVLVSLEIPVRAMCAGLVRG